MIEKEVKNYISLAEQAALGSSPQERAATLDIIDDNEDRVMAVLEYLLKNRSIRGLVMATSLWHYWWERGRPSEGRNQIKSFLDLDLKDQNPVDHARALFVLGHLAKHQKEFEEARILLQSSLDECTKLDEPTLEALVRRHLAILEWHFEDYNTASKLLHESPGNPKGSRPSDRCSKDENGETFYELSNLARAYGFSLQQSGDPEGATTEYNTAISHLIVSWDYFEVSHNLRSQGTTLLAMGNVRMKLGEYSKARINYLDSLSRFARTRDKSRLTLLFERIAYYAWYIGKNVDDRHWRTSLNVYGTQLIGISEKLRADTNSPLPRPDAEEFYNECKSGLRDVLGKRFEADIVEGRGWTLTEAIDVARTLLSDDKGMKPLTKQEVEDALRKVYKDVIFYPTPSLLSDRTVGTIVSEGFEKIEGPHRQQIVRSLLRDRYQERATTVGISAIQTRDEYDDRSNVTKK